MKRIYSLLVLLICLSGSGSLLAQVSVCVGDTTTIHGGIAGSWSSGSTGIATVGSTGLVTGVSAGTSVISYTLTGGTTRAATTVTVLPLPNAGSITGPSSVCVGANITLTESVGAGSWSASNTHAGVVAGVVTGRTAGTDIISYTVSNSCGTASATKSIDVETAPFGGTISGTTGSVGSICVGAFLRLDAAGLAGTWASSSANASVVGGTVTGLVAGTAVITLTETTSCGTGSEIWGVTVRPLPNAGSISGPASVCIGSIIVLTDPAGGGGWSESNTHGIITSMGLVGYSAGVDIISYTVSNSCGTAYATKSVTVSSLYAPYAGSISSTTVNTVCIGASIMLIESVTGGVWGSTSSDVTVSGDTVTGVATGMAVINYTVTNSCGTAVASIHIAVEDCSTGVPEINAADDRIRLFPNPNTGSFAITGKVWEPGNEDLLVKVTNVLGQVVYRKSATAKNGLLDEQIQLSDALANGMYIVSVSSGGNQSVFHIVVQR